MICHITEEQDSGIRLGDGMDIELDIAVVDIAVADIAESWMSLVGQDEFGFMPSEDTAAKKIQALVNWRDTFYKESRSLDILFDGVWNHEDVNLVLWMLIEAGPITGNVIL